MKNETNIIESVEFLAEDDLLVAELDKRLSFTAIGPADKHQANSEHCHGVSVCSCLIHSDCSCVRFTAASAVRG